jgi:hypothetical protein
LDVLQDPIDDRIICNSFWYHEMPGTIEIHGRRLKGSLLCSNKTKSDFTLKKFFFWKHISNNTNEIQENKIIHI